VSGACVSQFYEGDPSDPREVGRALHKVRPDALVCFNVWPGRVPAYLEACGKAAPKLKRVMIHLLARGSEPLEVLRAKDHTGSGGSHQDSGHDDLTGRSGEVTVPRRSCPNWKSHALVIAPAASSVSRECLRVCLWP
jgi:hypothetical protein